MVVKDMDICLNVCTGQPAVESTKGLINKAKSPNPQNKGDKKKQLNNNSLSKFKTNNNQSNNSHPQKRIKQKSLAQIVARNKAQAGQGNVNVVKKVPESKIQKNEQKNEVKSSIPTVTFAKPSETGIKTILAKPKPQKSSGKSLADVFLNKNNETNEKSDNPQKKSLGGVFKKKNENKSEETADDSTFQFEKPMEQKFPHKQRKDHFNKNNSSEDRPQKNFNNSGKVSSLFGNNPEVPNIGQRLVKPVNEVVFSKTKFSDLDIHPYMVSNLEQNMSISNMTTVQQKTIPEMLSGRDILVRSQTGSGKTLAYALPIVESLHKIRPKLMRDSGTRALVIVPTRELALQTYECFLKLIKPFTWIVPGYLVGGEKRKAEKARLRRGCTILVATPGRLLDHIKHTEALRLTNVKCFVLDEADRMLDMGYEKDISSIVSALKETQSDSQSQSSGYDPMAMLKQNRKIVFNDDDEETKTDDKSEEAQIDEPEPEKEEPKQEYHSGTDSEEDDDYVVKSKNKLNNNKTSKPEEATKSSEEIKEKDSDDSSKRQTILLSATLTNAVEKLAGLTLTDPVLIDAAEENLRKAGGHLSEINEDLVVPQGVVQSYIVTPPKLRMVTLCAYIAGKCQVPGEHKILVFMATQDMVDFYAEVFPTVLKESLDDEDESSEAIVSTKFSKLHGSMSQKERTEVFKTFRQARSGVLLCTDVAARGLDMPKVDTVVQYTGPLSTRDYVHRIGRTGRAGTAGTAVIFLTPPEIEFVRTLESRRIRIKQEDMNNVLEKLMGPFSKHLSVQATATNLQNKFENLIITNRKFHDMACKAYVSWIRFYSSYPRDMRELFNRKDLHLGHYAKSFALRDPPRRIGGIGKSLKEKNPSKQEHNNRLSNERPERVKRQQQSGQQTGHKPGLLKRSRILNVSEFGDGLEPVKKFKKK